MLNPKAVRITKPHPRGGQQWFCVYHWGKYKRGFFSQAEAEKYAADLRERLDREKWEREEKRREQIKHSEWINGYAKECERKRQEEAARPPEPDHTGRLVCTEGYLASMQTDEHRAAAIARCEKHNRKEQAA